MFTSSIEAVSRRLGDGVFRWRVLVTCVRVIDLLSPVKIEGKLAIGGDVNAGVNVVAMEVMQNLCRRYGAAAALRTTADEPFTKANVQE